MAPHNEGNSHLFGSLYELFDELSKHELSSIKPIGEYFEDFFTYSLMESDAMSDLLKESEGSHSGFVKRKMKNRETEEETAYDQF